MQEKVSVRELVAFTHHDHDLLPGGSLLRLQEGMQGHRARQREMADAQCERAVECPVEGEGASFLLCGRIDALYMRAGVPVVEEIKLVPIGDAPPDEPTPAHWAQAMCYGYMLVQESAYPYLTLRVLFVQRDGAEVIAFERLQSAPMLATSFAALAQPYLRFLAAQEAFHALRDASLRTLVFPYAAYRTGQRDLAVQVYWAIREKRRLFAQAPTGAGKTIATLFPALKAMGEGKTGQIFYLTARTTVRQAAADALAIMRGQGLHLRVLSLTAKEKCCPYAATHSPWRCTVLDCAEAVGFYDRLPAALETLKQTEDWTQETIEAAASMHRLCPFELSLSLCEIADVVLCDYNYAFDPGVRIKRIFLEKTNITLLVDEAHHLPDRARDMLSATLDSHILRIFRRDIGKQYGRKHGFYPALGRLIRSIESMPGRPDNHAAFCSDVAPDTLGSCLEACMDAAMALLSTSSPMASAIAVIARDLFSAQATLARFGAGYTLLCQPLGPQELCMTLFCLDPAPHLRAYTKRLHGSVFFSATLTPLCAYRTLLGGDTEDALLSIPSPFPRENLLVLRRSISTRYQDRESTAEIVARTIGVCAQQHPGNYLACFPSYQYVTLVQDCMQRLFPDLPLRVQQSGMQDAQRADFLAAFAPRTDDTLLGMIVLGGVFGEGIDLPGDRLCGVMVVGVALPQISFACETLRAYYESALGDGFAYAYMYPGMNKVLQAVGRVIRTETDRGIALLIDDRFLTPRYTQLMPPHWNGASIVRDEQALVHRLCAFWEGGQSSAP